MAKIMILGGTGTISRSTVEMLVLGGHRVTVLNRAQRGGVPEGADVIVADRHDQPALAEAIAGQKPDVLIDFVCFTPATTQALLQAATGKIGHLIFVSTADAFGYPLATIPAPDAAPIVPGVGDYALAKQDCEALLRDRGHTHGLKVTIARPTYSMGERFVISLFNPNSTGLINALRAGRPVVLPGEGAQRFHVSNAVDSGRMIARLATDANSAGKTYIVGTKDAIMLQRDYLALIADVLGTKAQTVSVPVDAIEAMDLPDYRNSVYANVTRFDIGFALDQFQADFPDFTWIGQLSDPIRAYVARLDREGLLDAPTPPDLETAILARWSGRG